MEAEEYRRPAESQELGDEVLFAAFDVDFDEIYGALSQGQDGGEGRRRHKQIVLKHDHPGCPSLRRGRVPAVLWAILVAPEEDGVGAPFGADGLLNELDVATVEARVLQERHRSSRVRLDGHDVATLLSGVDCGAAVPGADVYERPALRQHRVVDGKNCIFPGAKVGKPKLTGTGVLSEVHQQRGSALLDRPYVIGVQIRLEDAFRGSDACTALGGEHKVPFSECHDWVFHIPRKVSCCVLSSQAVLRVRVRRGLDVQG